MARINPLTLQRTTAITDTRQFTDPLQPGQTLEITLRISPDGASRQRRRERGMNLVAKYLTGDVRFIESKGKEGIKPLAAPLPPKSGFLGEGEESQSAVLNLPIGPVVINTSLCFLIATLIDLQEDAATERFGPSIPTDEKPYTFLEWVAFTATMPNAFEDIVTWADELMNRASGSAVKNSSGAAENACPITDISSDPPSENGSDTTPQ